MEPELHDVFAQLVATVRSTLNCQGIAVLIYDEANISVAAQFGTPALTSPIQASASFHRIFKQLAAATHPILAPNTAPKLPTPGHGRDWLAVPLGLGEAVYGYLSMYGEFDTMAAQRAYSIGQQTALTLHWHNRWRQVTHHSQQLRALDTRLQQTADQATALALLVDTSIALTQATHSCIFANRHGRAVMLARRGYSADEAALVQQIPPSLEHGLTGKAFQQQVLTHSGDIEHDPNALPALAGTRSQLIIPIVSGEQSVGIIDLQSPQINAFAHIDFNALLPLGHIAASALVHRVPPTATVLSSETEVLAEHDLLLSSRMAVVTDLAAGVAHEINNPLTTILGYTHLLLRNKELPQTTHDDITQIMVEGQRIAALVERFLRFAQPSSTGKCPLAIAEPLGEALGLLRSRIQESGIHLILEQPSTSPMVLGQAGQLEQAFLELLQNAIEAMSTSAQRQLQVSVAEQTHWVRITIADTGRGIRPDLLTRVFEPGFTTKVDKGISRGLGLGLYAVHTIAHDHWGRVEVQSQVWQGSSFTVCLPAI